MRFEWDRRKAAANLRKDGISFKEATTALRDDLALTDRDPTIQPARRDTSRLGSHPKDASWWYPIPSPEVWSASSVLVPQRNPNGRSMKKAKPSKPDELRPEYKRSDFGKMGRGKYANRISAATNVVVLGPEVAEAFPNDEAVNDALRSLINLAKASTRPTRRSRGRAPKAAARP